jgi:UDP-glucose 4-epimerase
MGAFNVNEACVRFGVRRLVNPSSETVPGLIFAERPFEPAHFPIDEEYPALLTEEGDPR